MGPFKRKTCVVCAEILNKKKHSRITHSYNFILITSFYLFSSFLYF